MMIIIMKQSNFTFLIFVGDYINKKMKNGCEVCLLSSLSCQGSFPGNLQLVLVLRPTTLLQRALSDIFFKFNKDEFKMKVPVRTATARSSRPFHRSCDMFNCFR